MQTFQTVQNASRIKPGIGQLAFLTIMVDKHIRQCHAAHAAAIIQMPVIGKIIDRMRGKATRAALFNNQQIFMILR